MVIDTPCIDLRRRITFGRICSCGASVLVASSKSSSLFSLSSAHWFASVFLLILKANSSFGTASKSGGFLVGVLEVLAVLAVMVLAVPVTVAGGSSISLICESVTEFCVLLLLAPLGLLSFSVVTAAPSVFSVALGSLAVGEAAAAVAFVAESMASIWDTVRKPGMCRGVESSFGVSCAQKGLVVCVLELE